MIKYCLSIILAAVVSSASAQTFTAGSYKYRVIKDGVSVAAASTKLFGNVIIPEAVNFGDKNYKVTAVADSGFRNCSGIKNLVLPASITKIGKAAFANCRSISGLNIPRQLTEIGDGAFFHCGAIMGLSLPENLKKIGCYAFAYCGSLRAIEIPDGVESIGEMAFWECQGLYSASVPKSVATIGDRVFSRCPKLQKINLDPENASYIIIDDALYTADKSRILAWPAGSPRTVCQLPDECQIIPTFTFCDCEKLREVVINPGLKEIENLAFTGCGILTIKKIPDSVTRIGENFCPACSEDIEMPANFDYMTDEGFDEKSF